MSRAEASPAADAVEMLGVFRHADCGSTVITRKFGRSPEEAVTVGSLWHHLGAGMGTRERR